MIITSQCYRAHVHVDESTSLIKQMMMPSYKDFQFFEVSIEKKSKIVEEYQVCIPVK